MHTKESIAALLCRSDRAVERAMVVLYERQTQYEQQTSTTNQYNDRGFNACHARFGSKMARVVKGGHTIFPAYMPKARKIALHYTRQLAEIANEKLRRKEAVA